MHAAAALAARAKVWRSVENSSVAQKLLSSNCSNLLRLLLWLRMSAFSVCSSARESVRKPGLPAGRFFVLHARRQRQAGMQAGREKA